MSGWRLDFDNIHDQNQSANPTGLTSSHTHQPSQSSSQRYDDLEDRFFDDAQQLLRTNVNSAFCTKENLLNSVGYINQEFQLLGLPCLKFDSSHQTFDLIFIINRIYDLLTIYHKTLAVKEDLENRNHRLACETEHLQSTSLRMKRFQDQADRELGQEQEKLRQINLKYKQISNKLKTEKEEVKRLTAVIQARDLQHRHDIKKKEREILRLKERLHQLIADKAPDRKVGMDMMNLVGRTEGRRATWKTGPEKQEEEMYQLLINNYEARHCEVTQENSELRDCLLNLQRELSTLLKRTGDMTASCVEMSNHSFDQLSSDEEGEENSAPPPRLSISDLNEGYFQMPYEMVRQEIEKTFKDTCNQISESMKRSLVKSHPSITLSSSKTSVSANTPGSSSRKDKGQVDQGEVDRLRRQVSQYKAVMKQQEELLQQSIEQQSQPMEVSFLHESRLLKEKENLAEQKKLFFEEKANFEKERQAYTEAAIRLGRERKSFQEEKSKFLKENFLNLSPFKESTNQRMKESHSPGRSRLLPATPVFSPAKSSSKPPSGKPSTPISKSDLYRALGLSSSSSKSKDPSASSAHSLVRLSRSSSTETRLADSQPNLQTRQDAKYNPASFEAAASLETIRASLLKMASAHRSRSTDGLDAASDFGK